MVRAQWAGVALGGLAALAVLGSIAGISLGRWASAKARAPWWAALPWHDSARKRSVRSAAVTLAAALTPVAMICGWVVPFAVRQPGSLPSGVLAGLVYLMPAVGAAYIGSKDADQADEPAHAELAPVRQSRINRLAIALDRSAPKWVGLWAQADNGLHGTAWWVGSLIVGAGTAGAISVAQWQPWPSVVAAVVGGNLVFMAALNGRPLLSPVLRSSPVGYGAVWVALVRLPAFLSAAWFAAATVPVVLVSRNFGGESAGVFPVLALLDILFCAAVALDPSSRRRATLLYVGFLAVIIYQGLGYGVAYGALAVAIMLGVVALLWRQARKRFRSNG